MFVSLNCYSLVSGASLVLDGREKECPQRLPSLSGPVLVLAGSSHEQNLTSACHLASSLAWSCLLSHWAGSSLAFFSEVCALVFSFPPQRCVHYIVFLVVLFNSCLLVMHFKSPVSSMPSPEQVYWTPAVGLKEGCVLLTCGCLVLPGCWPLSCTHKPLIFLSSLHPTMCLLQSF